MRLLVVVAVIFGLGALLGNHLADPEVEVVKVPETITVHDPPPAPVVKYRTPQACIDGIALAEEIQRGALKIDGASTRTIDLISEARIAATEQDLTKLSKTEERLNALQGDTSKAVQQIATNLWKFEKARKECK